MRVLIASPRSLAATWSRSPFPRTRKVLTALGLSLLGVVSEPVRAVSEVDEMSFMLRERCFEPLSDLRPRRRTALRHPFSTLRLGAPPEPILVAEKRTSA